MVEVERFMPKTSIGDRRGIWRAVSRIRDGE
jgi:hypothetical protein